MRLKKKLFASFVAGTLVLSTIQMNAFAQELTTDHLSAQGVVYKTSAHSESRSLQAATSEVITFADSQLQAYLNHEIAKETKTKREATTPITKAELASIEYLSIDERSSEYRISNLDGLKYAVNLERISITGKTITGFDQLKDLSNLTILTINDSENLEDLTFLGNKPKLTKLTVRSCKNLKSLNGLSAQTVPLIEELNITRNGALNDISSLSNHALNKLKVLNLEGSSNVTDITPLKGYTSLTKADFEKIYITDANRSSYIDTIKSLTNLERLDMPYCEIKDSDTVMFEPLDKLDTLILNMNDLTNIDFCRTLPVSITQLGLHGNREISDMSALTRFANLTVLGMGDCSVTDFSFLTKLNHLTSKTIRNSEGTKNFPMMENFVVDVKASDIKDGKIVVKNPYVDTNGSTIAFKDATLDNDVTILQETPAGIELQLSNIHDKKTYHLIKENYALPLQTGDEKNSELMITVRITGNPVHTHTWGDPTYTWSEDNKTCTAKRVCSSNSSHVETATANVQTSIVTPATCTAKGTTRYTATFTTDWATSQFKTVQDIAMLDHDYQTEWSSDANHHWHVCKSCGNKADVTAHDLKWVTDKEATQEAAGSKHQECSVCGFKLDPVEIPMLEPQTPVDPAPEVKPQPEVAPTPEKKPQPEVAPKTGDNANTIWPSLLGVSVVGLLGMLAARKKDTN